MTKKIKWRLSNLPTPDEVRELVKDKIITQEEAREILFSQEDEKVRDSKSLESEIKFLRELVDRLSKSNPVQILETIRYVEKPYQRWDWYKPYTQWENNVVLCQSNNTLPDNSGFLAFNAVKTF